jgi:hypothetical protein
MERVFHEEIILQNRSPVKAKKMFFNGMDLVGNKE